MGIDLATRQHQVVVLNAQGCRLTSFKVPHSRAGLRELVERCTSRRVRREGRVHFAFEATGHVWEAVGAFLAQRALRYYVFIGRPQVFLRLRRNSCVSQAKRTSACSACTDVSNEHFHGERNHQGKGNLLLFPCEEMGQHGPVRCRERLGGLRKFYYRPAA